MENNLKSLNYLKKMTVMLNQYKKTFSILLILFIPFTSFCQTSSQACDGVKNGLFYCYPQNTDDQYSIERSGDFQKEINLKNGDSINWKVEWKTPCVYSLNYISGSTKPSEETLDQMKKYTSLYEIQTITDQYYTFKVFLNKTTNEPVFFDTVWKYKIENVVSNKLFEPIKDNKDLRKPRFTESAKYALLYVYRPGKITIALSDYLIYFNNLILCVAKNNTGYIFKILKEGPFDIMSRLSGIESVLNVDIKFGHIYYVKSTIPWGLHKGMNFKLEMALMPLDKGKEEFENLKFN
jgi:hypothetical protein